MVRPLRVERAGGRYHLTARGNERKPIFRHDPPSLAPLAVALRLPAWSPLAARPVFEISWLASRSCLNASNSDLGIENRARKQRGHISTGDILGLTFRFHSAWIESWSGRCASNAPAGVPPHRRDEALWLGRRCGRLKLAQLGKLAGGTNRVAVGLAVRRFGQRWSKTPGSAPNLKNWKPNC
jgi:hypothetical protein